MNWLLPALLSPMFFAAVNHIDKHLLSRYFKGGGTGSLVIFSAIIGIPVAILIAVFHPAIFSLPWTHRLLIVLNGMIYMASLLPYFHALSKDEASIVAPLFQTIPLFSLVLGYVFLQESLTIPAILGGVLLMLGAMGLSLELKEGEKVRVKKDVLFLMMLASFLTAVNGLIFKFVAIDASFWVSAFWEYVGVISFGILAFIGVRSYRKQFLDVIRENNISILGLNAINEICAVTAKVLIHFASIIAPLAVVYWVAESFQPFFVFGYGVLLTLIVPHLASEDLSRKSLIQKALSIGVMGIGTYFLRSFF